MSETTNSAHGSYKCTTDLNPTLSPRCLLSQVQQQPVKRKRVDLHVSEANKTANSKQNQPVSIKENKRDREGHTQCSRPWDM